MARIRQEVIGANRWRFDLPIWVLLNCTPTFPNWIWGGRIAKNAGKMAVFPPPPPTVRVFEAFQIMARIFLQLTLQSAKGRLCDSTTLSRRKAPIRTARGMLRPDVPYFCPHASRSPVCPEHKGHKRPRNSGLV